MANEYVCLRQPGGKDHDDRDQRDLREPGKRCREQAAALGRLKLPSGAGDDEQEGHQSSEPNADRANMEDVGREEQGDRRLRASVARERGLEEQEHQWNCKRQQTDRCGGRRLYDTRSSELSRTERKCRPARSS